MTEEKDGLLDRYPDWLTWTGRENLSNLYESAASGGDAGDNITAILDDPELRHRQREYSDGLVERLLHNSGGE